MQHQHVAGRGNIIAGKNITFGPQARPQVTHGHITRLQALQILLLAMILLLLIVDNINYRHLSSEMDDIRQITNRINVMAHLGGP